MMKIFKKKEKKAEDSAPSFSKYLRTIQNMEFSDFVMLGIEEQKRIEEDYVSRYNCPIKWW